MATRDFTANQIRTAKVIMTGSAASGGVGHKNIELSVYSESVAPDQLGGTPTPSPYSAAGDDVSIFISGSQTSRGGSAGGVTLFHGDTFISGTLVVKNAGRTHGSISGSIQKMADGTDYIRVTGGLTATSGSDGSVTIDGSGISGGGDVSLNYYDESNAANPFAPLAAGDQSVVIGTKSLASAGSIYTLVFGSDNTGSHAEYSNILGGASNKIYNINDASAYSRGITIAGGGNNVITGSSSYSNIGGGKDNLITGSAAADDNAGYNTIAGGSNNRITGSQSTIGGGDQNETESQYNTIAGGNQNRVETFSDFSFVGGGGSNISSGNSNSDNAHYAVIAGGQSNKISATAGGAGGAPNSSILGGWLNKIQNSENSSILGGKNNLIDNNDSSMLLGQHLTSSAANQTILGYGDTFGGTGYVVASGSFFKSDGLSGGAITGSITRTKDNLSYLVAGPNVTIASASNGQVTISSTGGSSGTTFATAQYYSFEGPNTLSQPITASSGGQLSTIDEWGINTAFNTAGSDFDISNSGWIGHADKNLPSSGLSYLISFYGASDKWANVGYNGDQKPDGIMLRTTIPPGATQMRTHLDFVNFSHYAIDTSGNATGLNGDGGTALAGNVQFLYAGRLRHPGQGVKRWASGSNFGNNVSTNSGTFASPIGPANSINFNKGAWTGVLDGDWHENWHQHSTTTINPPAIGTPISDFYKLTRAVSAWKNTSDVVCRDDTPADNDQIDLIIIRNMTSNGEGVIIASGGAAPSASEDTLKWQGSVGTSDPSILYVVGVLVEFQ